jgi:hypothetical protein
VAKSAESPWQHFLQLLTNFRITNGHDNTLNQFLPLLQRMARTCEGGVELAGLPTVILGLGGFALLGDFERYACK